MSEEKSKPIKVEDALAIATSIAYTRKEVNKLNERIDSLEGSQKEIVEIVGPSGEQGPRGLPGIQGEKGDRGDPGEKGDRGEKGEIGLQGIPGAKGEQGYKGDKGDVGPVGPQGEQGVQGPQGEKGDKGDKGDPGIDGAKGDRGEKGDKGDIGQRGEKGDRGEQGLPGKDGKSGKDGKDGKQGPKGDKGDIGPVGPQGPQGERGEKGESGADADIKPLETKFKKFTEDFDKEFTTYRNRINVAISKALATDAWKATGSGEVNLRYLDDVDRDSIQDGFVLSYDDVTKKFTFVSPSAASFNPLDVTQVFAQVKNDESFTITKGQPVYLYQATGNRASVKLAYNTGDPTSAKTLGLVYSSSITPGGTGYVITQGVVTGVNTQMFSEGDTLYLGNTAGTLTSTKPYAPNHLVYIGVVERANQGQGQIYVRPQNGYELHEIHDVNINHNVPIANGHIIVYNSSLSIWENRPVSYLGLSSTDDVARSIANTAANTANAAYNQANLALTVAQAAYNQANTGGGSGTDNLARSIANSAYNTANLAYDFANTVSNNLTIVYSTTNSAFSTANAAWSTANAAYDYANTIPIFDQNLNTSNSVSFAELTITGNTTSENIIPASNNAYDLGSNDHRFKDLYLSGSSIYLGNTSITEAQYELLKSTANQSISIANSGFDKANSAFDIANTANSIAQAAYDYANTIPIFDQNLNTSNSVSFAELTVTGNTNSQNVIPTSNNVYDLGKPSYTFTNLYLSNSIYLGNTVITSVSYNTLSQTANNAYAQANTALSVAQAAYNQANTGGGGGGTGVVKTYNILNDFSAPLLGTQVFVPESTTNITKVQITNGETAGTDIMLGLYKNNDLMTFLTLASGLRTIMITGLSLNITPSDYITVNVVAGSGKNLMMTMFNS